jgi:hypothetical protein
MNAEYRSKTSRQIVLKFNEPVWIHVTPANLVEGVLYSCEGKIYSMRKEMFDHTFELCPQKQTQ